MVEIIKQALRLRGILDFTTTEKMKRVTGGPLALP